MWTILLAFSTKINLSHCYLFIYVHKLDKVSVENLLIQIILFSMEKCSQRCQKTKQNKRIIIFINNYLSAEIPVVYFISTKHVLLFFNLIPIYVLDIDFANSFELKFLLLNLLNFFLFFVFFFISNQIIVYFVWINVKV